MKRREFLTLAGAAACAPLLAAPTPQPNVIFIYADDLGYGDLGCYGSRIRTPNLDRMAAEGVRFTQHNSANPLCSPSRAALLTGRYPTRTGVSRVLNPNDTIGLPDSETTIAQVVKTKNYKTMCIGKWHLGHLPQFLPMRHGFDEYFGIPYSNDMNPRVLLHNEEVVEQQATLETLTQRYTEQALGFIERSKGSPFFLYMPHTFPHVPLAASPRFRGKSPEGLYGDAVEELDWSVGQVLDAVKKHRIESNTLVMFSSDNGPWWLGSPGKLRGRKNTPYEGGVREPFIARLPGRIPRGRVCNTFSSMLDVFPTIANLCGAPLPQNPLDGIDMWPLLTGAKEFIEREAVLYFDNIHIQCVRRERWKLHIARYNSAAFSPAPSGGRISLPLPKPELYDLENDADESYNVAAEHQEVVADLQARVDRLMQTFPDEIQKDYALTKARAVQNTEAGSYPRVRQ